MDNLGLDEALDIMRDIGRYEVMAEDHPDTGFNHRSRSLCRCRGPRRKLHPAVESFIFASLADDRPRASLVPETPKQPTPKK